MAQGLVYIFTGEGKGKTSAAIGTAVRAAGAGMRVGWVAFYKQASWKLSEMEPLRKLGVEVWLMGEGFHIGKTRSTKHEARIRIAKVGESGVVVDRASKEAHKAAAARAMEKAEELLGRADVLVMDEVNNAVADKLVMVTELMALIALRKKTHVLLTGRDAGDDMIEIADLVTEMKKIKHPYDEGRMAVRGLDF